MRTRIFLFTGHTGLDKKLVLETLRRTAADHGMAIDEIRIYALEEYLPLVGQGRRRISVPGFLRAERPDSEQRRGWLEAFTGLRQTIEDEDPRIAFVSLHASFYRNHRLSSYIEPSAIKNLNPETIVTLIDDVYSVWYRVWDREKRRITGSYFSLADLMTWRWVEVMLSDQLAGVVGCPNYVVGIKHPGRMLYRLLFRRNDHLTVYACIPISEPRVHPQKRREVDAYRTELHDRYIVFDPLTIDEKILSFLLTEQHPGWYLEGADALYRRPLVIPLDGRWHRWPPVFSERPELTPLVSDWPSAYPLEVDAGEAVEICRAKSRLNPLPADPKSIGDSVVDHHIRLRDYRLIDNSFAVPAYRPQFESHEPGGQGDEILYAHRSGKDYVIFHDPHRDGALRGGPFPVLRENIVFSKEDLFIRLQQFQEDYQNGGTHREPPRPL